MLFRLVALASAAAALFLVVRYPLAPPFGWIALAVLLIAYGVVLCHRPHWWLYGLLGLLPVLNLYPWTGWLFLEEFDLAVLVTLAVGYWRAAPPRPASRLSPLGALAVLLLTVSYGASALIPLRGADALTWEALGSYNTAFNSLRVLKGWLWPLLLLPLLSRAADAYGADFLRVVGKAMLSGLVLASGVVLWERIAFPGLMNFSTDYRAIGPFFEAHVGGAALDGYLALGVPLALILLLTARDLRGICIGGALVLLASYASFATFSRGLYAGIGVALAILAAFILMQHPIKGQGLRVTIIAVVTIVVMMLLTQVFASGGYRTLAAALGTFAAAIYIGGVSHKVHWRPVLAFLAALTFLTLLFVEFVAKGAYVAYGISAILSALGGLVERLGRISRLEIVFALCGWVGINAIAIGWHWGGATAMEDAAVAVVVAAVLALYNRGAASALWSLSWRTASVALAGGLLLGIAIPVVGNYYMKTRLDTIARDLEKREQHWQDSIDIRGDGWEAGMFGAGLGTYADRYYWRNRRGDFPGTVIFMGEGDRYLARLSQARSGAGRSVEPLRLSQRIAIEPQQTLALQIVLRSTAPKTMLHVAICEKWLLYTERCSKSRARFQPEPGEWGTFTAELSTATLGDSYWWGKRPAILTMSVAGKGSAIDITGVRLVDRSGRSAIANGDMAAGSDHWFFTSDHSHLPWHAKNLWLGLWFDQGWLGLAALVLLSTALLSASLPQAPQSAPYRTALFAGLAAFLVVGLFDTLLDATRLAAMFYLLCFVLLLQNRLTVQHQRARPGATEQL